MSFGRTSLWESRVQCESLDRTQDLRLSLFLESVKGTWPTLGMCLCLERRCAGKSVKGKHIDDIWSLVGVIKRGGCVPHTLLKNGKRGKEEFARSCAKQREKSVAECVVRWFDVGVRRERY